MNVGFGIVARQRPAYAPPRYGEKLFMHIIGLSAVVAFGLCTAGCAQTTTMWVKAGATDADFQRDKAACEYEAKIHTPSMPYSGMSGAISTGIQEGMRIGELGVLCMRAKGYSQQRLNP